MVEENLILIGGISFIIAAFTGYASEIIIGLYRPVPYFIHNVVIGAVLILVSFKNRRENVQANNN